MSQQGIVLQATAVTDPTFAPEARSAPRSQGSKRAGLFLSLLHRRAGSYHPRPSKQHR
jgi:hypothetical protein